VSEDYVYEVKWDGIRAMISLDEGQGDDSRAKWDRFYETVPELLIPEQAFRATSALFDSEIVCLEADGKPNFRNVNSPYAAKDGRWIERAKANTLRMLCLRLFIWTARDCYEP